MNIYDPTNLMGDLKMSKAEINNCFIQLLDPDPIFKLCAMLCLLLNKNNEKIAFS